MKASRRILALGAGALVATACAAPAASAQQIKLDNWNISGDITLAKLKQTLPLATGKYSATFDLATGTITSTLDAPPSTTRQKILGVPVLDTTIALEEAAPSTGTFKLEPGGNVTLDSSAAFYLRIVDLSSPALPLNIVGNKCRTAQPLTLGLHYSGPLDTTKPLSFAGKATIPKFQDCGWLTTPLLDLLLAGPDNAYRLTLSPPGGQAPAGGTPAAPSSEAEPTSVGTLDPVVAPARARADKKAPKLSLRVGKKQRVLRLGGAVASVRCNEECLASLDGKLRIGSRSYKLRGARTTAPARARRTLKAKLTPAAKRALRKALKQHKRASVRLTLQARDVAGNRSKRSRFTVAVAR
jgi:hypothetical protein